MGQRLQRYGRQLAPATKLNDREVVSRTQSRDADPALEL